MNTDGLPVVLSQDQALLAKKQLDKMGDVRDIATIDVQDRKAYFRVAFNSLSERFQGYSVHQDDEGYLELRAFLINNGWYVSVKDLTPRKSVVQ